jgi:hypothetical protein
VTTIIIRLIGTLLSLVSNETIKKALDSFLDVIENAVEKTPNKIDDALVLALCKKIREALDVPEYQS